MSKLSPSWLNPLVVVVAAFVGGLVPSLRSVAGNDRATAQREVAARREEIWRRIVFIEGLLTSSEERGRRAGRRLLVALAQDELASANEYRYIRGLQEIASEDLVDLEFFHLMSMFESDSVQGGVNIAKVRTVEMSEASVEKISTRRSAGTVLLYGFLPVIVLVLMLVLDVSIYPMSALPE